MLISNLARAVDLDEVRSTLVRIRDAIIAGKDMRISGDDIKGNEVYFSVSGRKDEFREPLAGAIGVVINDIEMQLRRLGVEVPAPTPKASP